ncbi:hypothetical protein GCM10010251_22910 [Streptomyces aurantiogriseus]|uniref:Uncharacterized protein n=1 Tax=Streptomyces aurantiogriseus TaxID=66870 RepID=A0A918C5C2_9ACTN|nr:hypothetical protein GCM10010251_22910 [Streptomyces aurantiogriseus]
MLDDADAGPLQDGEELVCGQWLGHVGTLSPRASMGFHYARSQLAVPLPECLAGADGRWRVTWGGEPNASGASADNLVVSYYLVYEDHTETQDRGLRSGGPGI